MNRIRSLFVVGFVIFFAGGCRTKSNPATPVVESDYPPSLKFAVTLYSSVQTATVGQSFEIRVVLYNVTNVSGCAMEISYPTAIVGILDASVGSSFLPPESAICISKNEPDSGRVSLGVAYRNIVQAQSRSGSGVVYIVICKAKAAGNCTFVINPNTLEIKGPDGTLIKNFDTLLLENSSIAIH